ncbi:Glycosyl hydrolases family 18 [compost metagenome]
MVLGFYPKSDGHLQVTDHQATFGSGATHLASASGRTGVISFSGASGAVMNGKKDLLVSNATFTFASWVYINSQSTYVPGKFIFKKAEGTKEVSLRIGGNYGQLIFRVVDGSNSYQASVNAPLTGILADSWNHIAITFNGASANGSQVKLYINGTAVTMTATAAFPATLPTTNSDFILGENFSGMLDEPLVNNLALGESEIDQYVLGNYPFNTFNQTKTVAFWNFDDATSPGKDLRSHKVMFSKVRAQIGSLPIKLHMTVSGGSWQTAVSTATGRSNFASDVNSIVTSENLDGVDVDLEWPTANTEAAFANYSAFVVALRAALGSSKIIALSLHPGYYKAGMDAINAANHVALQMYGPQTSWWSYSQFVSAGDAAVAYGIPKAKLIMGLPFFGTTGVAGEQVGYRDIITANPTISLAADQATYNGKTYTFNGVNTIKQKASYVCQKALGGIMAWDLSLHMANYDDPYSLLKAAISVLDTCGSSAFSSLSASKSNDQLAVDWITSRKIDNGYFLVEGSKDQINFYTIDSIAAKSVNGPNNKIAYSIRKNEISRNTPLQMGFSIIMGGIVVLLGLAVIKNKRQFSMIILLPGIAFLAAISGCKKQENLDQLKSPEILYVRVVHVDNSGNKTFSPVVTVQN